MQFLPCLQNEFSLDPQLCYLNHGGFGACPRDVQKEQGKWQAEMEANPTNFMEAVLPKHLREARHVLAAYLHCSTESVTFIPNTTYGVNMIMQSLSFCPGDEVLLSNQEYGAFAELWKRLEQRWEVRIKIVSFPLPIESSEQISACITAAISDRTKVIFLSHIASKTALIFPVAEIATVARTRGILTVFDGAHAPSQLDLDLPKIDADFYVGNCHKWLCAPRPSAFLYAGHTAQALLQPLVISWGSEVYSGQKDTTQGLPLEADNSWLGAYDPSAYLSVPTAIAFQEEHDWPAVRKACRQLARNAHDQLRSVLKSPALYPLASDLYAQMFSVILPPCDEGELASTLLQKHKIQVTTNNWCGKSILRVCIQCYNSDKDIERLIEALGTIF